MREGGIFACELGAAVNYFGADVAGLVGPVTMALRQTFAGLAARPGARLLFLASPDARQPTSDAEELARRWEAAGIRLAGFSPLYFDTAFPKGDVALTDR